MPGCKSETKLGTSNFCNLGPDYDLSYRTWKLLKAKMQESDLQEARLDEIEKNIQELRAEQSEIKKKLLEEKSKKAKVKM